MGDAAGEDRITQARRMAEPSSRGLGRGSLPLCDLPLCGGRHGAILLARKRIGEVFELRRVHEHALLQAGVPG